MAFPVVRGENLEGRTFTLPTDLEGTYNLLFHFSVGGYIPACVWESLIRKRAR